MGTPGVFEGRKQEAGKLNIKYLNTLPYSSWAFFSTWFLEQCRILEDSPLKKI